ncbi:hypothetical protein AB6A40_002113 [Gnathostoma spinigerum]|uniref:Vacuolar protein sorting-associated protein 16 homolog n=1 Tax=Gnathostoma spinigerum TaxID=75299 RepID=A0ABD6E5S7_9BILA
MFAEANLQKAFLQCLMAAAHQFDHQLQKKLLKAAALGKALSRCQDSSQFGDTCRVIRVLNAIRQPYIGIAISFTQSTELKMTSLINRLIDIEHWPLAMEFCKYMHLPVVDGAYRVLALWALSKIEKAREEKEKGRTPDYGSISELIVGQFAAYPEISFADVAMKAVDANLPEMAEILLEKETRPYRQVEMLLKLDKTEKALAKAARSQQPDLMHLVLAHIKRTWRKEKADLLIRKIPQAFCLYQDCLREEAPRHLLALYQQEDDFAKQALFHLAESSNVSWNPFDMSEKLEFLSKAEKCLTDLKEPSLNQLATDALALLKFGESLDAKPGFGDIDRTNLRSIFIWLAGKQEDSLLEQLRKNFKLSEKQYSTWKIEGLAKAKKWNHLENLVKTKKVTVGYLSLITLCVQYENTELASSFIEKLTSPDDVIKAHVLVGNPVRAAEIAAKRKDLVSLERIYNRFRSNDETARLIQKLLRECRTKPE